MEQMTMMKRSMTPTIMPRTAMMIVKMKRPVKMAMAGQNTLVASIAASYVHR
jgi:hypothetical protein